MFDSKPKTSQGNSEDLDTIPKARGDTKVYLLFHSIVSILLFSLTIYLLDVDEKNLYPDLAWFFTIDFLVYYLFYLLFSYLYGALGRILVYRPMKYYYNRFLNKSVTSLEKLNVGPFSMFSFAYFLRTTLSVFGVGIIYVLQEKILESNPLLSFIFAYIFVQGFINLYIYIKYK